MGHRNIRSTYSFLSFRLLLLCSFLVGGIFLTSTNAQAQADPSQPIYLITHYRCDPAKRSAFVEYMRSTGLSRFEGWKRDGTVADFQILFNSFVDADTWDMMILLKFAKYTDSQRWYGVAEKMPGGLDSIGLTLAQPFNTIVADLTWQDQSSSAANQKDAIYFIIPYEYTDKGIYSKYFNIYVLPQFIGWMRAGILSNYRIFMNNHPTGSIWDVLFVLEYRDLAAFSKRETIKQSVRDTLSETNTAWKLISDLKHTIREEGRTTITKAIVR